MRNDAVRPHVTGWPEDLSDEEAVQRLRTLCMGACDGIQDLADDSRYKALRRALLNRIDLRPLAPAFVAAQPNLPALVRFVRETRDRHQRRELVRSEFVPLLDEVAGATISASGWTGRATIREQALLVSALAPPAMVAVQRLLDDEARLQDNGGPVDNERDEVLAHLRSLHQALGELIKLAETGQPLGMILGKLRMIRQSARTTIATTMPVAASRGCYEPTASAAACFIMRHANATT